MQDRVSAVLGPMISTILFMLVLAACSGTAGAPSSSDAVSGYASSEESAASQQTASGYAASSQPSGGTTASATASATATASEVTVLEETTNSGGDIVTSAGNDLSDEQMDLAPPGASVPESNFSADSLQTVVDYLDFVVQNNDRAWTQFFLNTGLQEPFVSYVIVMPGETYTSNCSFASGEQLTVVHDTPNAYYCSLDAATPGYDGTVYLPVTTMAKMWTGDIFGKQSEQQGDFAAAIITAHEFGHHVVDEMRTQYSLRDGVQYQEPVGKYNELIADCMAGVWAASAYYQGFLDERADWDEAVTALQVIGDYELLSPEHHGTPQERMDALATGYNGIPGVTEPGSPDACIRTYWVTS